VKAIVCIVGIIAGGRLLVRPLYRRISNLQNSDVFAATTLLVVLGTSVLTQAAGLSLALGAFLVSWAVLNILVLISQNRRRAAGGARHQRSQASGRPAARPRRLPGALFTPCMCILFEIHVAAGGVGGASVLPHADGLLFEALPVRHTNNLGPIEPV